MKIRAISASVASLLWIVLVLPAGSAVAADGDLDFGRPGFYVGISGVYTSNIFDDQVDDAVSDFVGANVDVDIDDSFGLNARVGYRATSWLAFELQYEWIDQFEISSSVTPALPDLRVDIEGHSLTANVKLIVPTWRIQPYMLVGAGYALYDADVNFPYDVVLDGGKQSGFAGRVGGGIDWVLSEHFVLSTEATVLLTTQDFDKADVGSLDDLYYVSLGAGIQYRF